MPWPVKKIVRQQAERRGRYAEYYAMAWLCLKGYRFVAHRYRCPFGEIDLIAVKGNHLIAIEVKYRTLLETALFSITPRQQQRIERCLLNYQLLNIKNTRQQLCFDVVCVHGLKLQHLKNAWFSNRS